MIFFLTTNKYYKIERNVNGSNRFEFIKNLLNFYRNKLKFFFFTLVFRLIKFSTFLEDIGTISFSRIKFLPNKKYCLKYVSCTYFSQVGVYLAFDVF